MTPRRILVAGWLVFILYAYPGYVDHDAADQLVDSRVGQFTDWHSPMMTEVWTWTEHVIGGPAGMLFLQSLLLLCGTYSIARKALADRAGAWVAVAVLLLPPLIATSAVICPEAQLAAWLVAGFALLQSDRFGVRVGGIAMMVIAAAMRSGGAAATLPIVLATFEWKMPLEGWRRALIAGGTWLLVLALAAGVNYLLVDNRTYREEVRLAMNDIVGVLDHAPAISDERARDLLQGVPLATRDGIQTHARQLYGKEGSYARGEARLFELPKTDAEIEAVLHARRSMAAAYPGAYFAHRWITFSRTLGLKRPGYWRAVYTDFVASRGDAETLRHAGYHSRLQRLAIYPVKVLRDTPVFRPVYYLALAVVLLGVAIWRKRRLEIVLLVSGLAYEATLVFSSMRPNYRDSHTLTAMTLFAAALMIARFASEPRNKRVDEKAAVVVAGDQGLGADGSGA